MISEKLVKLSKKKEWWFEDVETTYSIALESLGLDLNSDISVFFLHIEDGPNFYSGKLELYQLAWHVINTDYINDLIHVQKALNLPSSYLLLSSLEGGSAYFYDIDSEMVIYYSEGRDNSELGDFNSFMENYFGLGY